MSGSLVLDRLVAPLQKQAEPARTPRALPPAHRVQEAIDEAPREIDPVARHLLEERFGRSLKDVRVHYGQRAGEAATDLAAEAFTVGKDIVFGAGRYEPETHDGLELLAHEVAHTVQQGDAPRGLQGRYIPISSPNSTLEHQADAAARLAVSGAAAPGVAGNLLTSRAAGGVLARRALDWKTIPSGPIDIPGGDQVKDWEPLNARSVRFAIPKLVLPASKGPALAAYESKVKEQALEATIEFEGGTARAGLRQSRAPTADLNERWLIKAAWSAKEANEKWQALGGNASGSTKRFPRSNPGVPGSDCDIDHIVELQLGGNNDPSNLAPLNAKDNREAGSAIWGNVAEIARTLRHQLPEGGIVNVILAFQSVTQAGGPQKAAESCGGGANCTCSDIDACASAGAVRLMAAGREPYPVSAGGMDAIFQVVPGNAPMAFANDEPNLTSIELIPGMIMSGLNRDAEKHHFTAFIESEAHFKRSTKTRLPIAIKKGELTLDVESDKETSKRRLKLRKKDENVNFTYPYLSEGSLKLALAEQGGLVGDGSLKPSIPLLRKTSIKVHLGDGAFSGELKPDKKQMDPGIPGFKVTDSGLLVKLAPSFEVTGYVDFTLGSMVKGRLDAMPSLDGLYLKGVLNATLPKLEGATGEVEYRNGELTGRLTVTPAQLASLPGSPTGSLTLGVTSKGLTAAGDIHLTLPNGNPIDMKASVNSRGRVNFTGTTTVDLPGLKPVKTTINYDGERFSGEAKTSFDYRGLSGTIAVIFDDGKFSGEADGAFVANRLSGKVHLIIANSGALYGEGSATIAITDNVKGTIALIKPRTGEIEVKGEIQLPPVIEIWKGGVVDGVLFEKAFNIPLFGPVALQVTPGLSYRAGAGPATINNAKVSAGFKPFAADTEFELSASATLSVPALARIVAKIGLGIAVDVGVGSIGGGFYIIGAAELSGGVNTEFLLHYKAGVFEASAIATISQSLILIVAIDGYFLAEVMGYELWHPVWHLYKQVFDTGLGFTLLIPFRYASNKPFSMPSLSEISLQRPQVTTEALTAPLRRGLGKQLEG